jgi:hypothetical protein
MDRTETMGESSGGTAAQLQSYVLLLGRFRQMSFEQEKECED